MRRSNPLALTQLFVTYHLLRKCSEGRKMLFRITGCRGQPDAFGANQRVRPESRSGPASAAGKMT